jgi:hypothetical protein
MNDTNLNDIYYIVDVIKNINMICYNLKVTNDYIYNFNENQNVIKISFIIYTSKNNKKSGYINTVGLNASGS